MRSVLECIINEHFVTCFEPADMEKWLDQVWNMLEEAYKYCGGVKGITKEALIPESDLWKLVKRGNKITAALLYTLKRGGRKACYMASDGTDQGKRDLNMIIFEDARMTDRDAWAEVSGRAIKVFLRNGHLPVPNTVAREIMKDKEFDELKDDGWFYTRKIGGEPKTKIMVSRARGVEAPDEVIEEILRLGRLYD
jgi:hypothetical protein